MYLKYNGIKLIWDRQKLLGESKGDFLPLLKAFFGFSYYTVNANTIAETNDEDEVTYAIVHHVLIPNKFRIVSISYLGSKKVRSTKHPNS